MWSSLDDFLTMGGHGFYVWSSYGAAALLVALEVLRLRLRAKSLKGRLANLAKAYAGDDKND